MYSPRFKRFIFLLPILFSFLFVSLHAQPKSRRSDITIKQLAVVGNNTVRIKRDPVSKRLYIVQNNGLIQRVNFGVGGSATFTTVYQPSVDSVNAPLGITFGPDGTMYLTGNDSTGVIGTALVVKGVPDSAGSENRTWSVIARTVGYRYGNIYNHRVSAVILNPTGDSLYVNSGAATDHGEMHDGYREAGLTSCIWKLPTSGHDIVLQDDREWLRSNGYLFAEGIRNTFDFAYAGNGDLIGPENSDDRDDPEELNWLQEGHHYGFPWRIGGDNTPQQYTPYNPHTDPLLSPYAWGGGDLYVTYSEDSTYPARPDSIIFTEPIPSIGPDADKFRDTTTGTPERCQPARYHGNIIHSASFNRRHRLRPGFDPCRRSERRRICHQLFEQFAHHGNRRHESKSHGNRSDQDGRQLYCPCHKARYRIQFPARH